MIVNRRTFIAKKAKFGKVVELLQEAVEKMDCPGATRIYASQFGPFDTVAIELEFKDWEQYHAFWERIGAGEAAWWEQWFANTETGGANEMWNLVE